MTLQFSSALAATLLLLATACQNAPAAATATADAAKPAPATAPSAGADTAQYACPMHPEVHQPGPGRCPKCGMALVPVAQ